MRSMCRWAGPATGRFRRGMIFSHDSRLSRDQVTLSSLVLPQIARGWSRRKQTMARQGKKSRSGAFWGTALERAHLGVWDWDLSTGGCFYSAT